MGSVKVQETISSPVHPNFCRFDNDIELNQWAEKRKLSKPISTDTKTAQSHDDIQFVNNVNNSKSTVSVKSTQTFRETDQSSQNKQSNVSAELPCTPNQEIPSISSNLTDSPSTTANVLVWGTVEKQPFKLLVDTGAAVRKPTGANQTLFPGYQTLFSGYRTLFNSNQTLFSGNQTLFNSNQTLFSGNQTLFPGYRT